VFAVVVAHDPPVARGGATAPTQRRACQPAGRGAIRSPHSHFAAFPGRAGVTVG
jgi:hypothetical protein